MKSVHVNNHIRKNTVYNMIKTCSGIVFPLLTFPYLSRVLTPEYVGKCHFSSTFVSYFSLVASLGLPAYAIRECAAVRGDPDRFGTVAGQLFSINICTTAVSYLLLWASLFVFKSLRPYRTLILIQSAGILLTTLGADWMNNAMGDFRYITIRTFIFQLFSFMALFLIVRQPQDYIRSVVLTLVSGGGANIMNLFYRKKYCRVRFTWDMKWKKHRVPVFTMFAMLLAQTIFGNTDITMLGMMRGDYEAGLYSTAVKISSTIMQLVCSIMWVMLPEVSRAFAGKDGPALSSLLRMNFQYTMGLGMPCITGTIVMSEEIMYIAGGKEYVCASRYLVILMAAHLIGLAGGQFLGNIIMLPSQREKYFLQACMAAAVVNFFLNLFLIPGYGAALAAVTTLISHFIIFLMLYLRVRKEINIGSMKENLGPPVAGCFLIVVWCILLRQIHMSFWLGFVLSCAGGALLYAGVLWVCRYEIFMSDICPVIRKVWVGFLRITKRFRGGKR